MNRKTFCAIFFICIGMLSAWSQSPLVAKVKEAQQKLNHFSYRMTSIDTFVNGFTRQLTGYAEIMIAPQDPLGGFYFKAYNNQMNHQAIYEHNRLLAIDHPNKQYTIEKPNPYPNLIGSAGAQTVVRELFVLDTARAVRILEQDLDSCLSITLRYRDNEKYDIRMHYTIFFISKQTYLPIRIESHLTIAGRTQSSVKTISDFKQLPLIASILTEADQELLRGYTVAQQAQATPSLQLIGKKVEDFQVNSLTGISQKLIDPKARLTLLDFWEVWCGPCIKAMPDVDALYKKYKEKGLHVTGILHEKNSLIPAKKITVAQNSLVNHVIGTAETEKFFQINAVPLYVLVDEQGFIRYVQSGFSTKLEEEIVKLLASNKN